LFRLIGIDFLREVITRPWFAIPASTLAFAYAVHITDVRVSLVQGMRNLLHVLLAWLLPVATVLIVGFVASLPFTGLAPLWRTSHGSEIVLAAVAVLVLLINAAYRDGGDSGLPLVQRWTGSAAALCLPVLVAISAYGLGLRIAHRGWTSYRIVGVACLVVAGCYAAGYAWATLAGRPWMKRLEITNVVAAGMIVLAVIVLTTPIADPARLSVRDQVARLRAGRTPPEAFDFKYLRFDTGRYGRDALERLKTAQGPNAEVVRQGAERALALTNRYASPPPKPADVAGFAVFPPGQALPQSFVRQDWTASPQPHSLPGCLLRGTETCEAFVVDAGSGDIRKILVIESSGSHRGVLLQRGADEKWQLVGTLSGETRCDSVRAALRAGDYRWIVPQEKEIEAAGQHLKIIAPSRTVSCR
jgi:hypothetical protein